MHSTMRQSDRLMWGQLTGLVRFSRKIGGFGSTTLFCFSWEVSPGSATTRESFQARQLREHKCFPMEEVRKCVFLSNTIGSLQSIKTTRNLTNKIVSFQDLLPWLWPCRLFYSEQSLRLQGGRKLDGGQPPRELTLSSYYPSVYNILPPVSVECIPMNHI